jgi:hypothetical protein
MDAKRAGNALLLVGTTAAIGGSHHAALFGTDHPGLAADPDSVLAEVERRAAGLLQTLPTPARRQAETLIRTLTPTAATRLDQFVAAFGPRAGAAVRRLATRLGNPAIEKLAAEVGPERVQAILRVVATAAESTGLSARVPAFDPHTGARAARAVAACISGGLVAAAHDCSDGGMAVAIAEMLIAGSTPEAPVGATLAPPPGAIHPAAWWFAENPGRYLLEVPALRFEEVRTTIAGHARALSVEQVGVLDSSGRLRAESPECDLAVEDLATAWRGTLDW